MSSRTRNSKQLKRVSGELQITPVLLDLHRPPTAGSPLKRCSNDTDLNLTFSQEHVNFPEEREEKVEDGHEEAVTMSLYESAGDGLNPESSTQESLISDLDLLDNTSHSPPTPSSSDDLVEWGDQDHERSECDPSQSPHQNQLVHSQMEERLLLQSLPTFFHSQRTAILSSRLTISDGGKNKPMTMKQINTVITTATTLGLPGTVRGFSGETPSPVWSLQNQPGSEGSASSSSIPSKEANKISNALGDGDTSCSTPKGSRGVPPSSPGMSEVDRAPFMLSFRKPKRLPRSRITSTRGSSRQYSLPTTASTPNPVSQPGPQSINPNRRVIATPAAPDPDPNNNQPEPELAIDANNNEDIIITTDKNNNEPGDDKKDDKGEDQPLLPILDKPNPDPKQNEVIALEAKASVDWEDSGGTVSEYKKKKTPPPSLSSSSGSGSSSSSSSEGSKSKTSDPPAALVTTEKGAIRFHLPGRIQHKTTIKVAHFPVNSNPEEPRDLIVNVKPQVCEEEEEITLPNNFSIPPMPAIPQMPYGFPCPPPPAGPYSYPPFGYPQPPPQPYYYGYPPYY